MCHIILVADLRHKLRPLLAQDPPHEPRRLPPSQGQDAQIQEHQQEGRRALQEDGLRVDWSTDIDNTGVCEKNTPREKSTITFEC